MYERLHEVRALMPEDSDLDSIEPFMAPLVTVSAFDLGQGRLTTFSAYRFLYERLIGAEVRPWLPSAFCSAAALPHLHPDLRRKLLQSISEAAATASGWSNRQPAFYPQWVEKVDARRFRALALIRHRAGLPSGRPATPSRHSLRLVEVQVIAVRRVVVRREHGREQLAGAGAHVAQERGLFARPFAPIRAR
jgi:hypothetical protein